MDEYLSPAEILRTLGIRFKDYRLRMNLTQKEISDKTGVSIPTIYKFETGKLTDLTTSNLMKLLKVIGQQANWDKILPELPESPYLYKESKKRQRVKHTGNESN